MYFLFPKLPFSIVNVRVGVVILAVVPVSASLSISCSLFTTPPVHPLNMYPSLSGLTNVKDSVFVVYDAGFVCLSPSDCSTSTNGITPFAKS